MRQKKPVIGIVLDLVINSPKYNYASFPWYALRQNYADSVLKAGGIPLMIPYQYDTIDEILSIIDGLIIPGGDEDIHPKFYGQEFTCDRTATNDQRDEFELLITKKALERHMPFLGICRGMQLLNIICGGDLIQHIADYFAKKTNESVIINSGELDTRSEELASNITRSEASEASNKFKSINYNHEQPAPKHILSHSINIIPKTILAKISGLEESMVNSTHHQAVGRLGAGLIVSALAPDGIIEAIESTNHQFVVGVEWHPEYLNPNNLDLNLFKALISAASKI